MSGKPHPVALRAAARPAHNYVGRLDLPGGAPPLPSITRLCGPRPTRMARELHPCVPARVSESLRVWRKGRSRAGRTSRCHRRALDLVRSIHTRPMGRCGRDQLSPWSSEPMGRGRGPSPRDPSPVGPLYHNCRSRIKLYGCSGRLPEWQLPDWQLPLWQCIRIILPEWQVCQDRTAKMAGVQ